MTHPSPFFAGVHQRPVDIRGVPARSPLFFHDLDMMTAVFTADLTAARDLPSGRLSALSPAPGTALIAIHCFEYRASDVGPYNEVSITVAVRVDRSSRLAALARSTLQSSYQGFIRQLPVTTEVALHGGLDFFNYPKFLAQIAFEQHGTERRCTVSDPETGALIYAFASRRPAFAPPLPRGVFTFRSYPVMGSDLVEARMVVHPLTAPHQSLGGDFRVRVGTHDRSAPLAALRPRRLLQVVHAPRCEAILVEPVTLGRA